MKKLLVSLFSLSIYGCSNCDCSIENYQKLKNGQSEEQVEKILGAKPVRVSEETWKAVLYRCSDNGDSISVSYDNNYESTYRVVRKSFN
jgi:hypothetical protein